VNTTKQRVPPAAQIVLVVVAVLLVAIVGWFALVHPQSTKATALTAEIATTQTQLDQARIAASAAKRQVPIRVANLFRLVKAMPDSQDMSGILLQLNQVAQDSGITFESIKPGAATALAGYSAVPITLNFSGTFYNLSDFLLRLRNLVAVRHGELDATGRLFAVDTLGFGQGHNGFPQIEASLTVDAFIYGGAAAQPSAAPTTTAPATTTGTTTTPAGATAAGTGP
jgi:type IV pilus assembly protein PilO